MKRKGFTLIELIVVIAVLAVLALLVVPMITGYIDESKKQTCASNRALVERAIKVAQASDITVTSLDELKDLENSLYTGGEVCPSHGDIAINKGRVFCTVHNGLTIGVDSFEIEHNLQGVGTIGDIAIGNGQVVFWNGNYYVNVNGRPGLSPAEKDKLEAMKKMTPEQYLKEYCVKINFDKYYDGAAGVEPKTGDVKKVTTEGKTYYYVYDKKYTNPEWEAFNWVYIDPIPFK